MKPYPKVSVVLPTYNSAHLLDDAIGSVLEQTYTDFELVIVDNQSTDKTDEVVAKYLHDARVVYHKNETNIGLTGNWNRCMELARGKYIKFICSDDKFHPQILERFVPVLDEHPNVSIVGCFKEEFDGHSYFYSIPFHHSQPGKKVILETVKNYNYLGEPTCVMFRKEDVPRVGGFKNFRWITDWEMWVRLMTIGDCYIVPERLCFTRNHPGQLTKDIWYNYVHFWEEYHFFKALRNGEYNIDLSDATDVLDKAIKLKAAGYAQVIPKSIMGIKRKASRKSLRQAFRIMMKERVFGKSFALFYDKMTWKMANKENPQAATS